MLKGKRNNSMFYRKLFYGAKFTREGLNILKTAMIASIVNLNCIYMYIYSFYRNFAEFLTLIFHV